MHGTADLMSDPAATAELVERAGSGDKTLELVPGVFHALLRDLDRDTTLDTISGWIDTRFAGAGDLIAFRGIGAAQGVERPPTRVGIVSRSAVRRVRNSTTSPARGARDVCSGHS